MKVGKTVTIRNGKIDMFKGTMRLAVDKWGLIQEAESQAQEAARQSVAQEVRALMRPPA